MKIKVPGTICEKQGTTILEEKCLVCYGTTLYKYMKSRISLIIVILIKLHQVLKFTADKNSLSTSQCPADTEGLESIDIYKDPIPDGVELHTLR